MTDYKPYPGWGFRTSREGPMVGGYHEGFVDCGWCGGQGSLYTADTDHWCRERILATAEWLIMSARWWAEQWRADAYGELTTGPDWDLPWEAKT